jgi:hypothetical protein
MLSFSVDRLPELVVGEAEAAIDRGINWLVNQQDSNDGGWHSQTYGAMRGGASMTALVLYAASHLPKVYHPKECWQRGLDFLIPGIRMQGFATCPDGTLDFPTYSTAMTLLAIKRMGMEIPIEHRKSMIAFLIAAQLTEVNGFHADSTDFGGWDSIGVLLDCLVGPITLSSRRQAVTNLP